MTTYGLNETKMFMDIADGIAIVINNETGIYYGFNGFGTVVLEALSRGVDSDVILKALQNLAGAPSDLAHRFSAFVEQLVKNELLIPGSAGTADVSFDPQVAATDHFDLDMKAYTDAQEMLLADPIHEVREETGWTPEKKSIGYTKEETKEREKKIDL